MIGINDKVLADRYYTAWNAHDIDAIMALYADDIEFCSPYIIALQLSEDGVIFGKSKLREYFLKALARAPDLKFVPESLCVGARGHTLIYRNHRGERAAEVHELEASGLIIRADATYETV